MEALQYRERTRTRHSQLILELLRLAVDQFDRFRSPRMTSRLTLQMADEEMAEGCFPACRTIRGTPGPTSSPSSPPP